MERADVITVTCRPREWLQAHAVCDSSVRIALESDNYGRISRALSRTKATGISIWISHIIFNRNLKHEMYHVRLNVTRTLRINLP